MTDESTQELKSWTYAHRVKEDDLDKAVERFRIQIENASEHLKIQEDLEAPYDIEARMRIVDRQEDSQNDEVDKVSLSDWGDDPE
jgi:hypothetical protein